MKGRPRTPPSAFAKAVARFYTVQCEDESLYARPLAAISADVGLTKSTLSRLMSGAQQATQAQLKNVAENLGARYGHRADLIFDLYFSVLPADDPQAIALFVEFREPPEASKDDDTEGKRLLAEVSALIEAGMHYAMLAPPMSGAPSVGEPSAGAARSSDAPSPGAADSGDPIVAYLHTIHAQTVLTYTRIRRTAIGRVVRRFLDRTNQLAARSDELIAAAREVDKRIRLYSFHQAIPSTTPAVGYKVHLRVRRDPRSGSSHRERCDWNPVHGLPEHAPLSRLLPRARRDEEIRALIWRYFHVVAFFEMHGALPQDSAEMANFASELLASERPSTHQWIPYEPRESTVEVVKACLHSASAASDFLTQSQQRSDP